jgi:hypothetical protein
MTTPNNRDFVDYVAAQFEVDTFRDLLYPKNQQDIKNNKNYLVISNHPLVPLLTIPQPLPAMKPHRLYIGRRYLSVDNRILEFMGRNVCSDSPDNLLFREWTTSTKGKIKEGVNLKVQNIQHSVYMREEQLKHLTARVYCEAKTNRHDHLVGSIVSQVIPDNPPQISYANSTPKPSQSRRQQGDIELFTDAALKLSTQLIDNIFFRYQRYESFVGGVIFSVNQHVEECLTIPIPIDYIQFPDSYELEAITLYSAINYFRDRILYAKIFIDNQKLVQEILKNPKNVYLPEHPLTNLLRHLRIKYHLRVFWIRSHSDRKSSLSKLSFHQSGNVAADALTNLDTRKIQQLFPYLSKKNFHLIQVPFTDQAKDTLEFHHLLTADASGNFLPFSHQIKKWATSELTSYLDKRTEISTRKIPWNQLTFEFSYEVLRLIGLHKTQILKMIHDKYTNQQYSDDPWSCKLCFQGPDNREHLLICQNLDLCCIRHLTGQALERLPFERMLTENADISYDKLSDIRNLLIRSAQSNQHTRVGLFDQQQLEQLNQSLETLLISKNSARAIRTDFLNILQITASGLYDLIRYRNDYYFKNKSHSTQKSSDQDKTNDIRFREIKFFVPNHTQIITYRINHNYPVVTSFIQPPSQENLNNHVEQLLGIKGTLYQATNTYNELIFSAPIYDNKPIWFWPSFSYSSPLRNNQANDKLELEISKERIGELLYFRRFRYLLSQGLKLIRVDGFQLLYKILVSVENWSTCEIPRTNVAIYLSLYQDCLQYINNLSELIIFLNWNINSKPTIALEEICKWHQLNSTALTQHLHHTLNKQDDFTATPIENGGNLITFKTYRRSTYRVNKNTNDPNDIKVISLDLTNHLVCSSEQALNRVSTEINNLITLLDRHRSTINQQEDREIISIELIQTMVNHIRMNPDVHMYHKKQILEKLKEIKERLQYYQIAKQRKSSEPRLPTGQSNIKTFLKL